MSADEGVKIIAKKLDKLAVAILQTLQNIVLERKYLEDNLKDGYINIAKARYLMQGRQVSMLQVNENNLVSTVKVFKTSDSKEGVEFLNFNFAEKNVLERSENNSGIRSRKAEVSISENFEKMFIGQENQNKDCETSSEERSIGSSADPLKWFGVLVPENLKISQSRFKQATATALKICSLQNQLKSLGAEYKKLKKDAEVITV